MLAVSPTILMSWLFLRELNHLSWMLCGKQRANTKRKSLSKYFLISFQFKINKCRCHSIVADGRVGASNPLPHHNPQTFTKSIWNNRFSTFWLSHHGPTDRRTEGQTDKAFCRDACPQLKSVANQKNFDCLMWQQFLSCYNGLIMDWYHHYIQPPLLPFPLSPGSVFFSKL